MALAAVAVAVAGSRRQWAVWCLVFVAGRVAALIALSADTQRCAAILPPGSITLEVRVLEPSFDLGSIGLAQPIGQRCRGPVEARWPKGLELSAGTRVRLDGRWIERPGRGPRREGLLVASQVTPVDSAPTPIERLRNWLARTIRALYGARTGTVEALVINRRGEMPVELRDRYARAGLVHILSISGFHVGVIVAWVVLAGKLLHRPKARATGVAALLAGAYVLFLGWPAPAARASLLVGLGTLLHLRQRHPQAIALLATVALLVLLLDPWAVLDAGAWLSVSALGGALIATRWSDRAWGTAWWQRTLSGSLGATLATAPITAALFGMVSIVGVALNFVAIPLAALAVPGMLLSLLLAAVSRSLAAPLAAGSGALLGLLDLVAWWGGRPAAAAIIQPTGLGSALPWVAVLGLAGWSIAGGTTRSEALRRVALGLAAGIWVLFGVERFEAVGDADSLLSLHFLDVGQGDAALLRTPAGHWVLVDAGPRTDRDDAGRRVVAPFLARHRAAGVSVAIISHAHADHLGGLPALLERYPAGRLLEPAELVADPLYTGLLDQVDGMGIPWMAARDGMRFELDGVRFSLLHPDTAWAEWRLDLNEDSVVLLVEFGAFRALFPGDAGVHAESRLAGRIGKVDLLKVGHHGSRSASGEGLLAETAPRAAIISSGRGNRYGHPHPEVLERLSRHGIGVWRTDELGTITVITDGTTMTMSARHREETTSLRPRP